MPSQYPRGFNVLCPVYGLEQQTWYTPTHYESGPMLYIMDDFGNAYSPIWKTFA